MKTSFFEKYLHLSGTIVSINTMISDDICYFLDNRTEYNLKCLIDNCITDDSSYVMIVSVRDDLCTNGLDFCAMLKKPIYTINTHAT